MIVHVADDRGRTIGEAPPGARIRATSAMDSDRTRQAAIRSARFRKFGFNAFRRDRYLAQDGVELGDRLGDGGERGRWPAGRTAVADQRP
jgi:hypothetical protein